MWAALALQGAQRLSGAGAEARMNQSQMSSNNIQISSLRASLASLDDLAVANIEGAETETRNAFESVGQKLSQAMTDFRNKRDDVNAGGFAHHAGQEETFDEAERRVTEQFSDENTKMQTNLSKVVAGFESVEAEQRSQVLGQIKQLEAQNKALKGRSKWYQNIF